MDVLGSVVSASALEGNDVTQPRDQLHGMGEVVVVTARDSCIEASRCVDGSSCLYEGMAIACDGDLEYLNGSTCPCEVMATACDGDLEYLNGSTCPCEVMATGCDGDLGYVAGGSRIRGLGCDVDRPGDGLVETVVPVIDTDDRPAQNEV